MRSIALLLCALLLSSCVTPSTSMSGQLGREPTNAELVEDFIGVTFAGPSKLMGTRKRATIYKVSEQGACINIIGERAPQLSYWIEDARRLYTMTGVLDLERDSCAAKTKIHIVLLPKEVTADGPEAIVAYALSELGRIVDTKSISPTFQNGYRSFVRQRYNHPSTDVGWFRKLCIMGPSFLDAGVVNTVITISVDYGYPKRCAYEEIIQALGLSFDTVKAWPSIVRINFDGTRVDTLDYPSPYDLLNLRVLYDPRIKIGMSAEQVQPIASNIISEIRPDEDLPPSQSKLGFPHWTGAPMGAPLASVGKR